MRPFFWKIVLCLVPCVLAGWVATVAIARYYRGESRGFKLGVDLVGGTILVYEIDTRKQLEQDKSNPQRDTHLLAESLKRRIDPNDLYNIVIRPAGGEGRVEIILPVGGKHVAQAAEEAWHKLLDDLQREYTLTEKPEVGRGKILDLAETIHRQKAEAIWASNKVFGNKQAWGELIMAAYRNIDDWPQLSRPVATPTGAAGLLGSFGSGTTLPLISAIQSNLVTRATRLALLQQGAPGKLKDFSETLQRELGDQSAGFEKTVDAWIKKQAWDNMLDRARHKWPELKLTLLDPRREEDDAVKMQGTQGLRVEIVPDSHDELVGFIQTKGNEIGAAGLAVLQPLVGRDVLQDPKKFVPYEEANTFIEENYGPSLRGIVRYIEQDIEKQNKLTGRGKDLTVEEVQRIKDLISKVGSLEFRILANEQDDAEGIKVAMAQINNPANQQKLRDRQKEGLPPPPPIIEGTEEQRIFKITLARGEISNLTYSWVELGPQERKALNFDNAAENDPQPYRSRMWQEARSSRDKAAELKEPNSGKKLLNGALFYSRRCEDRNLPEEERKAKAIEYFVLTRDPELDPTDPTSRRRVPKIDGSYLINAAPDRTGGTPAVHFVFNSKGGELFGNITRKNVPDRQGTEDNKRHLAIILDGLVMSAPTINSEIRERGQITGSFSQREVDQLVNILRAGALPASLKPQPVSESTLGATLGEDTIESGVGAIGGAFLAVVLFMIVYYRFAGFVASIALLANLVLTIGFMVAVQATFTLPGLAGLVLMLGMAVDANVLIYERLREERERGASLALALRNGYDRALPTIIDTHLSSIFTAVVLYIVGNDQLKGFGVTLTVGLIISLFTSLFMTRVIFDIWQVKGWLKKLSMLKLLSKPDIDFMGPRYYFFAITLGLAILGMALFVGRLPNDLDIDFRGGTAYGGRLISSAEPAKDKAESITELRDRVSEANRKKMLQVASVKEEEDGRRYELKYAGESFTRTVSLANKLEGGSPAVNEKLFLVRAGYGDAQVETERKLPPLPDPAVEQTFPSFDKAPPGKSHFFTIRTTEKETELVQTIIDRLMHDADGSPLLQKVYMRFEPVAKDGTRLRFFDEPPPADYSIQADLQKDRDNRFMVKRASYASPSFVKTLLVRELMREPSFVEVNKTDKTEKLKFNVEVTGEGNSREGRFATLKVTIAWPEKWDKTEPVNERIAKVQKALERTQSEFEARPQPERLENFDSQLAAETQFRAMWAILASWGAIMLYLWFRFGNWTFGLAAVICLIHDLFLTLGVIAACHYVYDSGFGQLLKLEDFKIDLPAVAALLTLVGYSVNDTIVVFDRIREVRGKNPDLTPQMINDSVNQTLSRTLLTSFTTWLVVVVLYWFGGPGVHLFAFVMVVGVIVGTYSSIYIASPLLLMFGEGTAASETPRGRAVTPQPESAGV